jgi:SAM-dependent methyltransferase
MKSWVKTLFKRCLPRIVWDYIQYRQAVVNLGDAAGQRAEQFRKLVEDSKSKRCLQIGARNAKLGEHWVCADLYDMADYVDYHYDIHDLKFADEEFDVVVCGAVLEHVDDPLKAISELRRVLKPGGLIWIEVPFNHHYHPAPKDHWRVSPTGMLIWMRDFVPLAGGLFTRDGSPLHTAVFFFGSKRQ